MMKSRLSPALFSAIILLICLGLISVRQVVHQDSGEREALKTRLAQSERSAAEARFRERLAEEDSRESKSLLAQFVPGGLKGKPKDSSTYQLRAIASVVNSSDANLGIERASTLLERAKDDFRQRRFEAANTRLRRLLNAYPDSAHGPEARFLLVEGQYQAKDFEACIEVI